MVRASGSETEDDAAEACPKSISFAFALPLPLSLFLFLGADAVAVAVRPSVGLETSTVCAGFHMIVIGAMRSNGYEPGLYMCVSRIRAPVMNLKILEINVVTS